MIHIVYHYRDFQEDQYTLEYLILKHYSYSSDNMLCYQFLDLQMHFQTRLMM